MIAVVKEKSLYESHFQELKRELNGEPEWLSTVRRAALDRFLALGFPSTSDEEWRFTNAAPIARTPFRLPAGPADPALVSRALEEGGYRNWTSPRMVFVNGRFASNLSTLERMPPGLSIDSLEFLSRTNPDWLKQHISRYAGFDEHAFVALNTAFFRDGAVVRIAKNAVIDEPVHVLYLAIGEGDPMVCHPRTLIVAEANSQIRLLESYNGTGESPYWTNAITEIVLEENAIVDHCKVQRESMDAFHVATLQVRQSRSSNFTSSSVSLGGRLTRNDVNAVLDGEGSESVLNGLYAVKGQQHVDNHTRIDHAKPHCISREFYKGILDDQARGVFNGRIIVRQGAQKTDSKQTNRNLLLSEEALANTNPQLEIYADDVKCTHGATVGQLSSEAIFYLRSRGIALVDAKQLLTYAFGSEITGRIKIDPVREELERILFSQLPQNHEVMEFL